MDVAPAEENRPPSAEATPAVVPDQPAANDDGVPDHGTNLIKRTVDEVCALMADVHDFREDILAHGVKFHMLNAMIELGVHDKTEELATMMATAVEVSVKAHGPQAITLEELQTNLDSIVVLEKDLRHVRHVASKQGVHMQAFNHLTQLMRLNPGDDGVQAINTFLAYADAAGVPLDRMDAIRAQFTDGPKSVLPDIPRDDDVGVNDRMRELGVNVLVGLALTALVMWMVL